MERACEPGSGEPGVTNDAGWQTGAWDDPVHEQPPKGGPSPRTEHAPGTGGRNAAAWWPLSSCCQGSGTFVMSVLTLSVSAIVTLPFVVNCSCVGLFHAPAIATLRLPWHHARPILARLPVPRCLTVAALRPVPPLWRPTVSQTVPPSEHTRRGHVPPGSLTAICGL